MAAACVVRFNLFSMVYGILLLFAPTVPNPTLHSMTGVTGTYMSIVLASSGSLLLCQITFQSYLLGQSYTTGEMYESILGNCSAKEKTLRQIGFQRLYMRNVTHILHLFGPDIAVFCVFFVIRIIYKNHLPNRHLSWETLQLQAVRTIYLMRHKTFTTTNEVGIFIMTLVMSVCSVIHPSGLNAVYLLVFFGVMTSWSFLVTLQKRKHVMRISTFLSFYTAVHLILLYLYQFQSAQDLVPRHTPFARVIGLTALVIRDCSYKPWGMQLNSEATWPMYVNPVVVYLLYYVAVINYKNRVRKRFSTTLPDKNTSQHNRGDEDTDSESDDLSGLGDTAGPPHMIFYTPQPSSTVVEIDEALIQRKVASELFTPRTAAIEFMQQRKRTTTQFIASKLKHIHTDISVLTNTTTVELEYDDGDSKKLVPGTTKAILLYISRQGYICTPIVMMMWSINFHNWLTFVFLLVSCIIWVAPMKQYIVLKLSPYFLIYSLIIFISNYIYSLQLLEDELPTSIRGYKLAVIGLVRRRYPMQALAVQLGLMLVFWLTLREKNQEKAECEWMARKDEQGSKEIKLSQTASWVGRKQTNYCTIEQIMKVKTMWDFAVRYWIYICLAILFVIAINGRVVFFRVIYLMFFLGYIICFQMSFSFWCWISLGFWWVVIVYTMLVLCAIYIYQFNKLDVLTESTDWLHDIGLEQYDTASLYVELLTPTLFLIVCNIQVHYLHRPLLDIIQTSALLKKQDNTVSIIARICETLDVTIIEVEPWDDLQSKNKSRNNPLDEYYDSYSSRSSIIEMGNMDDVLLKRNTGITSQLFAAH
ncbi:Piezo-type mechanosensitive ion channel component 1 [Lamellibrachia satsuma]|nr:Piezo-type mechanosensitive ion channel component 1 [Lamellibrachia satsuma]